MPNEADAYAFWLTRCERSTLNIVSFQRAYRPNKKYHANAVCNEKAPVLDLILYAWRMDILNTKYGAARRVFRKKVVAEVAVTAWRSSMVTDAATVRCHHRVIGTLFKNLSNTHYSRNVSTNSDTVYESFQNT